MRQLFSPKNKTENVICHKLTSRRSTLSILAAGKAHYYNILAVTVITLEGRSSLSLLRRSLVQTFIGVDEDACFDLLVLAAPPPRHLNVPLPATHLCHFVSSSCYFSIFIPAVVAGVTHLSTFHPVPQLENTPILTRSSLTTSVSPSVICRQRFAQHISYLRLLFHHPQTRLSFYLITFTSLFFIHIFRYISQSIT